MSRDILASSPVYRRLIYRIAFCVTPFVPIWATRLLSYAGGVAAWFADPKGRRVVSANIGGLLGRDPRRLQTLVRRNYVNFCLVLSDTFRLHALPRHYPHAARVKVIDPWNTLNKRPLKGPMIMATAHANWEMLVAVMHRLGYAPTCRTVALSHGDEVIDALFERARSAVGNRSLLLETAPQGALRALRQGRLLGIVADRDYSGAGVTVPINDKKVSIPVGPAALSIQTGTPVVPLVLIRRGPSNFTLVVDKPLLADPALPKRKAVKKLTTELTMRLTRILRAVPGQWVAFHPYWKD